MAIRAPRRLSASHRVDAFDSGAAILDFWLREQALASARTAATYVVSDEQDAVLGSDLLRDALLRSLASTQQVAAYGLLVHALDERSMQFYLRWGFVPCRDHPRSLLLPLAL